MVRNILLLFIVMLILGLVCCKPINTTQEESEWFYGNKITNKYVRNSSEELLEHIVYVDSVIMMKTIYSTSSKLQQYIYYSREGVECYKRNYNKDGDFESQEGEPSYYGTLDTDSSKDYITDKDTVVCLLFGPTVSNCNTTFSLVHNDSLYPVFYKHKKYGFLHYGKTGPSKSGNHEFCFAFQFKDSITDYSIRKDKCIQYKIMPNTVNGK